MTTAAAMPKQPLPKLTQYAVREDLQSRGLLEGLSPLEEKVAIASIYGGPGQGFYGLETRKKMRSGEIGVQGPPPSPTSMQVQAASQTERERRKRRKGYGSTILAGGELGVASTTRKQILG